MNRKFTRLVVVWITGHSVLNYHKWGNANNIRNSKFCEESKETTEHWIWDCPALEERRRRYLELSLSNTEDVEPLKPQSLVNFIRSFGLEYFTG